MIVVKKGNLIEVTGGNRKQQKHATNIAHWCIRQLMPRIKTLDVWIHLKKELDGGVDGYCWEGENNRQHFIEIRKTLEGDDFDTCIMHEMVHVKQQSRNEFQPLLQKMEDEAYEKQEILLKKWNEDILQKILLERRKDAY
jgi:hypothetical protein